MVPAILLLIALGICALKGSIQLSLKAAEGQMPFSSMVQATRSVQVTMFKLSCGCPLGTCCLPGEWPSVITSALDKWTGMVPLWCTLYSLHL